MRRIRGNRRSGRRNERTMKLRVAVFAKRFSIIISRIVGIAQGRILHSVLPLPSPCVSLRIAKAGVEPALKSAMMANRTLAPFRQIDPS